MTYLNGIDKQSFDNFLLKFLPKCEYCDNIKFHCCCSDVCKLKQFICLNCQHMHESKQHFLHQVIQSRQVCLDDQLNQTPFIDYYDKIIIQIEEAIYNGYNLQQKLRIRMSYLEDKIGDLKCAKNKFQKRKEIYESIQNQRNQIFQKLRQIIQYQFSQRQIEKQHQKIKQCIQQLYPLKVNLDQEKQFIHLMQDACCQCYEQIDSVIQNIQDPFDKYRNWVQKNYDDYKYNLHIRSKTLSKYTGQFEIQEGVMQVKLNIPDQKHFKFSIFPKSVTRVFIQKVSINKIAQQIQHITNTNITQLYISHMHRITQKNLKTIYKQCLNQQLRILYILGTKFKYQQHELKLKVRKYQIKGLHNSGMYKLKRFLRQQIMEMFND